MIFTSLLVNELVREPALAWRTMREVRESEDYQFLDEALLAIRDLPETPESAQLFRLMSADTRTLARIIDPNFLAAPDAIQLARRLQDSDPTTDVRLLRLLQPTPDGEAVSAWQGTRALEILANISDGHRILTLLPNLLRHPDGRVRSKAALLIGRFNHNLTWLQQRLSDADPRVRANAVESFWGANSHEARDLFLLATSDSNYRVAANGVVGLHRAGDLASARVVQFMSEHSDGMFRSAAAWAMGETEDPRFLPLLTRMLNQTQGAIRRNSLGATARIRKRITMLHARPSLTLECVWRDRVIEARVWSSDVVSLCGLPATAFVVEGAEMVAVQLLAGRYEIALSHSVRCEVNVKVHAPSGMGESRLTKSLAE